MAVNKFVRPVIWNKTKGRCWYCGRRLVLPKDDPDQLVRESWFVPDHVVPLALGGGNDPSNLVPACWACNASKGQKTVEEYRLIVERRIAGIPRFTEEQLAWLVSVGFRFPERKRHTFWAEKEGER